MLLNKGGQWVCLLGNFFPLFFWFFFLFLKPYSYMIIHFYFHTLLFCCPYINAWAQKKKEKTSAKEKKIVSREKLHTGKLFFFKWIFREKCIFGFVCQNNYFTLRFFLLFKWFRICYNSSQFIFNFSFASIHCI